MTQIYNAGIPVQAYSIQQKRTNSPQTPVNFKAGRDEFIRNVQNRQSDFTKIMEERQKEQNKAKRKQKWTSALQIGALVSTIALAGFFIWQGTRGNKKAVSDLTATDSPSFSISIDNTLAVLFTISVNSSIV